MSEFELIRRIASRAARAGDSGVALGIGDDAAVLDVPRGEQLVAAVDALVAGVHFPHGTAPGDIGWKAIAVNVSDLAAMGATPRWALLSMSLPDPDLGTGIADGVLACARKYGIALVGGDTTRGPLSVSVTLLGSVPRAQAVQRAGARADEEIWIAGTLGDAAAGLSIARGTLDANTADGNRLLRALNRPLPPLSLGLALRGTASAMIDVSDGVFADLNHVMQASGIGALIDPVLLPSSPTLRRVVPDVALREQLQTSGDDYTLLFTAPPRCARRILEISGAVRVKVARIGRTRTGRGLGRWHPDAQVTRIVVSGFDHFGG